MNKKTDFIKEDTVESSENTKWEDLVGQAQMYVVLLTDDLNLNNYFKDNDNIKGAKIITVKDIGKLNNADMTFFVASDDIDNQTKEKLSKLGQEGNIKVYIAPKKLKNLGSVCSTYINDDIDYKIVHLCLKSVIEAIHIPSLVGLDYADVKHIFLDSKTMVLKLYRGDTEDNQEVIEQIKKDFKKIDNVFYTFYGDTCMTLDNLSNFDEKLSPLAENVVYSAKILEGQFGIDFAIVGFFGLI
jgi:hypothetical protein